MNPEFEVLGIGRIDETNLDAHGLHGVEEHLRAIFRVMMCARGITHGRERICLRLL